MNRGGRAAAAGVLLFLCLLAPAAAHGQTLYGFFPSPPEITQESILATYKALGEHGDLVLIARNVPWKEFAAGGSWPCRTAGRRYLPTPT